MSRRWRKRWWHLPMDAWHGLVWLLLWPVNFVLGLWHEVWWNISTLVGRGGLGRLASGLWWLVLFPFVQTGHFVRWAFLALLHWPSMVHLRFLLEGMPAVIVFGLLFYVFAMMPTGRMKDRYHIAAENALADEDFDAAMVYYKAAIKFDDKDPSLRFGLARAAYGAGEHERARALIASIAPVTSRGLAEAHYWQARELLAGPRNPETLQAAEGHLLRTLEARPDAAEVQEALGMLYFDQNRIKEAEEYLFKAADKNPRLWLVLARIHVLQDKRDQAKREAEKAFNFYATREGESLDAHNERLICAEALAFLERYRDAEEMLNRGFAVSQDQRYKSALATVYLLWSQSVRAMGEQYRSQQMALLEKAFLASPDNPRIVLHLMAGVLGDSQESFEARRIVSKLVAQQPNVSILHFLLGLAAQLHGDPQTARQHFADAGAIRDGGPALVANLARTIALRQEEINRALALIDTGLQTWNNDPDLRHARGVMLMLRGQWRMALPELEAALPSRENDRALHAALAEVYRRLGMVESARDHLRRMYGAVHVEAADKTFREAAEIAQPADLAPAGTTPD